MRLQSESKREGREVAVAALVLVAAPPVPPPEPDVAASLLAVLLVVLVTPSGNSFTLTMQLGVPTEAISSATKAVHAVMAPMRLGLWLRRLVIPFPLLYPQAYLK